MRAVSAIIGASLALFVATMTFLTSGVDVKFFINILGLGIVFGGTISAILLSYSMTDVTRVLSVVGKIFLRRSKGFNKTGVDLMKFAEECSLKGIPSGATGTVHPFLNDCLVLIGDGYSDQEIREMLEQRIMSTFDNEKYEVGIIKSMSKYPPAFGMVGTVVGLIALMSSIGGQSVNMGEMGQYMAIALTTTLYGLMISNFIFSPISDNLEISTKKSLKTRQLIMEAALLIKNQASLIVIQDTINSLVPPREAVNYIGGGGLGVKSAA